nr:hypothetical protein [Tanacetum cinerariifolium]
FAVEHQREGFAVLDAEQDHGGETFGIDLDAADVAALAYQGLGQEAPHVIVTDAGQHGGFHTQSGGAKGDVGRGPAKVFGETADVLQARADLLRVKIDAQTSEAHHV